MNITSKRMISIVTASSLILLSACSGGADSKQEDSGGKVSQPAPPEPVTLIFYNHAPLAEEMFQKVVAGPVKQKFPHVTLEKIDNKPLDEVIASGVKVDIISSLISNMVTMLDRDFLVDLNPHISNEGFKIADYYDAVATDLIKAHGKNGQFYGLPSVKSNVSMYYNKDIFDRFGVPYPKDGLTWDDTYEIAKKLTRTDGDLKLYGLDLDLTSIMGNNQLSLPLIDAKTEMAGFHTGEWSDMFRTLLRFFELPGSRLSSNTGAARDAFVKEKSLAMLVSSSILGTAAKTENLNWALATTPSFSGKPETNTQLSANYYGITPRSVHQAEAFRVIQYLVSDEVMTLNAQNGRLPATNRSDIVKKFSMGDAALDKALHLEAYYTFKHAATPEVSAYRNIALSNIMSAFKQAIAGNDINTALREAQEKANKEIEQAKRK